uniref:Uncharacterized protein n=1 Tax=Anopheles melas TaxID=34690 RepID=A0A182TQU6_9DIPT
MHEKGSSAKVNHNGLPTGNPPVGVRGWVSTGDEAEAEMAAATVDAESCTCVATAPIVLARFLRRWISSFFHWGMTFGSRAPPLPPPTTEGDPAATPPLLVDVSAIMLLVLPVCRPLL